jgi:hypothetical protein
MEEACAKAGFPESQQAEDERQQQRNFCRWPEVNIRVASEWFHLAKRDRNEERFRNPSLGKRAALIAQEF